MYNRVNPWQSYRQVAAQTATPGQLVLMLYDGSIRFLEKALDGFNETDPLLFNQTINNNILKAQAIIHELSYSLNMDLGGEFAERLHALYDYIDRRLQESNVSKTQQGILESLKHLTIIRDAWSEMLSNGAGRSPSTIIPAANHLAPQVLEDAQFVAAWVIVDGDSNGKLGTCMVGNLSSNRNSEPSALRNLLHQWRDLTELEREAIIARAFDNLKNYQELKRLLQEKIVALTPGFDKSNSSELTRTELGKRFPKLISELIELETLNHNLLASAMQGVMDEIASLDSCHKRIRKFLPTELSRQEMGWKAYG